MAKTGWVVLDLETKKTLDEVGGRDHLGQLGVTICCLYDYDRDVYFTFEEKDLGLLQNHLINTNLIIGFNHVSFDMPVLQPYFSIDVAQFNHFDIMLDLQKKLGHRVGLDSVAKATLGVGKTGHGLDAIRFYREGRMKELIDYCQNDVKVTKDVFDYGLKNKSLSYMAKMGGQKKEVKLDWAFKKKQEDKHPFEAQYKLF
ncbi:MAG: hypothetical protein A3G32_00795 [Deltaproteobacteria bacterium RIFCSPLOWO2_12_FULL_40_28]|nr:MAG: hypothetical protein A3C45_09680 [Deltaproteobacteria bacterium RIFCSPHIGHO2_02_FULL_40_28]OGQ19877.1 MAG: hypothetical protein A3E27_06630 [Deltaproteobacteria bacterium RIFCSPHIGHO2_12_FULL_40_32]OGQ39636.1 MAG: hypothetical protein A3I69_06060 [Deltaproteobacteria bacterium RIFCSPLOWO2_02_FULL_40_36]OGQ52892.1 MAG: hypothetical protein A3G32_00795 [Deltaproteobacteria bacterium RIFCSPLOWO2_12_FULL_40_28]